MSTEKTVLSIQSHVTHGYVGNKAATFPLQLHGFDVDGINTVSLSNHSGYPIIRGHRMDLEEFQSILEGLRGNAFLPDYGAVLTGYINNVAIIQHVATTVAEIRQLRQEKHGQPLTFFCDPVMGDDGRLYCKEEVIVAYRELLGVADVATPNYFEASVLSGVTVVDMATAIQAADWFHAQGTEKVVIKSFPVPDDPTHLQFLLSCRSRRTTEAETEKDGVASVQRFSGLIPFHKGHFTGTGDVFAASLVAFSHDHPIDVAVGKAMAVLQDLILATLKRCGEGKASLNAMELRVTDSPNSLLCPSAVVTVTPMP